MSQRQVGRQERSIKVTGMSFKSRLAELTAINLPSNIRATLPSMWPIQGNTLTALVLDTHYHSPVKLQKDFYCQVHECLHSIARMDKIQLCIWDMIFPSMRFLVFAKAMKTIFFFGPYGMLSIFFSQHFHHYFLPQCIPKHHVSLYYSKIPFRSRRQH